MYAVLGRSRSGRVNDSRRRAASKSLGKMAELDKCPRKLEQSTYGGGIRDARHLAFLSELATSISS